MSTPNAITNTQANAEAVQRDLEAWKLEQWRSKSPPS